MSRLTTACAILAALPLLASCAPGIKFDRSYAGEPGKDPKRILVVQSTPNAIPKPKERNEFKAEFSRLLDQCRIRTAFSVNNNLATKSAFTDVSPDADVESDKISALKPDTAFILNEISVSWNTKSMVSTYEYEAKLVEVGTKKTIWTGYANAFMGGLNPTTLGDLAREMILRMQKDKVLQSCPAKFTS